MRPMAAFAALLLLTASGCDSKATLSGRVTLQGEPVTTGTIVVMNRDSTVAKGNIQSDGRYSVSGVSRGIVRIGVVSDNAPRGKGAKTHASRNRMQLRHELANPLTSGLECEVVKSHTLFDLELK